MTALDHDSEQPAPDCWRDVAHILSYSDVPDWLRGAHPTPGVFAPEAEVRATLKAIQSRMEAQDPAHPWPDITVLSGHEARRLLVQVTGLDSLNHSQDAPTWWTALAARAACRALEPESVWVFTNCGQSLVND